MILQPYQQVMQDQLIARLVAAILYKLGETSITISEEDLKSLPPGHIESEGDPFGGAVTYRFKQYDHPDPDQQELALDDAPPWPAETFKKASITTRDEVMREATVAMKIDDLAPEQARAFWDGARAKRDMPETDPEKKAASELTDAELGAEFLRLHGAWDEFTMESLSERLNEVVAEMRRRGQKP